MIKNKKILIVIIVIILALAGAGAFYAIRKNSKKPADTETINYSPPTSQEKQAANDRKEEIIKQNESGQNPPTSGSTKTVKPVIVDASQYGEQVEVRSYVPGIVENGGTCSVSIKLNDKTVSRSAATTPDATTTGCPAFQIPRSEFASAGSWTVTVSYSSPTASGSSVTSTLEVR